jgi:hypothetical protein
MVRLSGAGSFRVRRPPVLPFFSGDYSRADNGVDVLAPCCRIYRFEGPAPSARQDPYIASAGPLA